MNYDHATRTAHWKGEDIPLRSDSSFWVEQRVMRQLVTDGVEWLEVHGERSTRRINVVCARRHARHVREFNPVRQQQTSLGQLMIPWRVWERIEHEAQPVAATHHSDEGDAPRPRRPRGVSEDQEMML